MYLSHCGWALGLEIVLALPLSQNWLANKQQLPRVGNVNPYDSTTTCFSLHSSNLHWQERGEEMDHKSTVHLRRNLLHVDVSVCPTYISVKCTPTVVYTISYLCSWLGRCVCVLLVLVGVNLLTFAGFPSSQVVVCLIGCVPNPTTINLSKHHFITFPGQPLWFW